MVEQITSFRGQYGFLSNFYECFVEFEGFPYGSVEAAYQAAKTKDQSQRMRFLNYSSREAKAAGRSIELRSDWNEVRIHIMHNLCKSKFTLNPHLRKKLIDTYPMELVEANTWGDKFWGTVNGEGSNFLGRILMIIRDELMAEE